LKPAPRNFKESRRFSLQRRARGQCVGSSQKEGHIEAWNIKQLALQPSS